MRADDSLAARAAKTQTDAMKPVKESFSLQGKLLVAMPAMGDPRFARSVIFVCAHSGSEAMGLIVNRRAPGPTLPALLRQLDIEAIDPPSLPIRIGGPVEHTRGFVLHSPDYSAGSATRRIPGGFALTATLDVLEDLARGAGPSRALLALGYAGWGPGQLEEELRDNAWLTCDAGPELVFADDDDAKWGRALRSIGIDPMHLSGSAGHA